MRIAYIDVNFKEGSTGKIVYDLMESLPTDDTCIAFYGRGKKSDDNRAFKFGFDLETVAHAFLTRVTGLMGYFSYFSTKKLIKQLKCFKPDVVHIHEIHSYFLNYNRLFSFLAKSNIPVIFTEHCEFNYTGRCGHSFECEKWKNECSRCPHKNSYPKTLLFDFSRFMFRRKKEAFQSLKYAIICAPSTWLLNRSKESFLGSFEHRLVPNSIDTSIFKYCDMNKARQDLSLENRKTILLVANDLFGPYKGGKYFLKLIKMECMKQFKFIVIGNNKKIPFTQDNVEFIGPIYDKKILAKYYSASDLFLITSEIENFPTTCLEAACCGTPIVGFDVGGIKEAVNDDVSKLVPLGDIESLASTVMSLALIESSREKNSKKYISMYSEQRMASTYYSLYEYILNKKKTNCH